MTEEKRRESAIANELKRLAVLSGGELRPQAVVESARDEASPLHGSFEWDDSHAAEQWRIQQARMLIRAVVTFEHVGNKIAECRVFVSLTPDREKAGAGYRLAASVLSDADQRRQMLADARAEMIRFKTKYQRLTEFAAVFEAIDAAVGEKELAQSA